jgi:predicted RNA binding protein YcfA (HicA-like mRNA interferase family)
MLTPTFQTLRQVLLDLGFQMEALPTSHIRFTHPRSETVVVFRPYKEDEAVDQAMLIGVRRLLDERGVVSRDEFDDLLRQQPLAG